MFEIIFCTAVIIAFIIILFSVMLKHCSMREIIVVSSKEASLKPEKIIPPRKYVFINPFTENYCYLSFDSMLISIVEDIFGSDNTEESFSALVAVSPNSQYWPYAAKCLAGLSKQDIMDIAENIIRAELKEISKTESLLDFYRKDNYEKYFDQINKKLNKVGLELLDI